MKSTATETAMERVIRLVGSQRALAIRMGVSAEAVRKWKARVPAERVLDLENVVGGQVSRHELRPDLYPVDKPPPGEQGRASA